MAAIALADDVLDADPDAPSRFVTCAREAGLLSRSLRDGLAIAPPLVIELETIAEIAERLTTALDRLASG